MTKDLQQNNMTNDHTIGFTEWVGHNYIYMFNGQWRTKKSFIFKNVNGAKMYTTDELFILYIKKK